MPPWWKIRRELVRPFRQLIELPGNLSTRIFGSFYFDRFKRVTTIQGAKDATSKVAVFVIFPRCGSILATHHRSIRFLNQNGYSVTLVSNAPVTEESINEILGDVTKLIIRPNFGYDFGGYRQGVLDLLANNKNEVTHLLLVNDSCWFPTIEDSKWILEAEQENRDLVGLTSNYGISRKWGTQRDSEWKYSTSHKNFHYCSFALLFSKNVIYNPKFWKFWKNFPLTNRKSRVVRRGEIGLTQFIIKNGFSHGSTLKIENLKRDLEILSLEQTREIFKMLVIPEHDHLRAGFLIMKNKPENTKVDLDHFILKSVAIQGAAYGLGYYFNVIRDTPFLKKSPYNSNVESRRKTLEIIKLSSNQIQLEIYQELRLNKKNEI
jgi:hypothetical protein